MAYYPHSSIEMDGGDLISITDVSINLDNKAQAETTMKRAGAGFSHGPLTVDGSFTVKNSTVSERDFIGMVKRKEIKALTFKHPDGSREAFELAPSKSSFKDQEQGASTTSIDWVGFVATP